MLKAIMLQRSIEKKRNELEELRAKDEAFATREAEIEEAIQEAQTAEEEQAVSEEVEKYDAEKQAHENAKSDLAREIEGLENDLAALEEQKPEPQRSAPKFENERMNKSMTTTVNIRALPMSRRAFDSLPMETRQEMLAQNDVKEFLTQLRSMKGQQRAVSGAELTIPVVFLVKFLMEKFGPSET